MTGKDVNTSLMLLQEKALDICKRWTPRKGNRTKQLIPRDRKILMRKRSTLKKKLLSVPEHHTTTRSRIQDQLVSLEHQLMESHEEERARDERRAVSNIKENSKYFFTRPSRPSDNGR